MVELELDFSELDKPKPDPYHPRLLIPKMDWCEYVTVTVSSSGTCWASASTTGTQTMATATTATYTYTPTFYKSEVHDYGYDKQGFESFSL